MNSSIKSPIDMLNFNFSGSFKNSNNPLKDKIDSELTWDALENNGYFSEIAPLIYSISKVNDNNYDITSINLREKLKSIYLEFMLTNMLLHNQLSEVLRALQNTKIKVIVLKGAALAESVYGNIALRPMSDIDLLVSQKDMDMAEKVLINSGFTKLGYNSLKDPLEKHPFHLRFIKSNMSNVLVELHWSVSEKPFNVEIGSLMNRAVIAKSNGMDTFEMCPNDLLPYLCLHTANHLFTRLLWICDISQVIKVYDKSINWQNVIERSKTWKTKRTLYYSLYLAKTVLGAQVPEIVLLSLKPSALEARLFDFVMINMDFVRGLLSTKNRLLIITLKILIIDRFKDRIFFFLKYIKELVFPGIPYIQTRYSISQYGKSKLYQYIHPFILIWESILWGLEILSKIKLNLLRNSR